MASAVKPFDDIIQLSADKDRFILIALKKIEEADNHIWVRNGRSPKGARQARILDLGFNPLMAIPYEDFSRMLQMGLLDKQEDAGMAGERFKINTTKTVKAS